MLQLAIALFIISIIAGLFGFTGVASTTRAIAKVIFFILIVLFVLVLLFGFILF